MDGVPMNNFESKKIDLRTRRTAYQESIELKFTLTDIAKACEISVDQVMTEKHRGYFNPDDLRSVVTYIARKIFMKTFK